MSGRSGNFTTSVTNSSDPDARIVLDVGSEARFKEERRAEALVRIRRLAFLLLVPVTLALAVNVRIFGDSMPVRVLALVGMLGLAAMTHVAVGERFAGRRAIPIAIAFVIALGVLFLGVLTEMPGGRDMQVRTISALMMGAAIVIPWGVWPQLVVAGFLAIAYGSLPEAGTVGGTEAVDMVISLTDCVALSAVGAYMLDRQRRKAFAESERAMRLTGQREILLDASRELNATLDFDTTVATITRVGRSILAAETVALILIDEHRNVVRTVSVDGEVQDIDQEVMNLEVPLVVLQPLVDELRTHHFATTSSPRLRELAAVTREQFGILSTLFVAIERDGELLGYVNFNFRSREVAFTDEQVHLARGFASHCAIALANAHLVDDLQRASRVKSEFVSTMSHELRTPLSVILGYADVLDDALKDVEARVVLDRIRLAGRELLELVQATLDLNRLESGQDPAQTEPIFMQELWDELASQYAAIDRPPGVALRWELAGAPIALADRRKLKIIVKNLVGNALKFTTEGEILASVRAAGDRCLVVVRDTGIGIPAEHLDKIFEMFRQVDNSDRRAHGGVGLGLYIVRKLCEQVDATLDVRSAVGQGTTFTVSLPAMPAPQAAAAA
jgi:signal transduction histidine kinase